MAEQGVLMTTVTFGANLTEKAMGVPLGAVRAVRDEVFRTTFAAVDWVEGVNQSSFKIVREMLKGIDGLSKEVVDGLNAMAGAMASVIRGSGEAAGEMVSKTAASLTGTKEPSAKQIAVA